MPGNLLSLTMPRATTSCPSRAKVAARRLNWPGKFWRTKAIFIGCPWRPYEPLGASSAKREPVLRQDIAAGRLGADHERGNLITLESAGLMPPGLRSASA